MMPCLLIATYAVHLTEWRGLWSTTSGISEPQKTLFLLLTWPENKKWASSENQTSSRKLMWLQNLVLSKSLEVGYSYGLRYSWKESQGQESNSKEARRHHEKLEHTLKAVYIYCLQESFRHFQSHCKPIHTLLPSSPYQPLLVFALSESCIGIDANQI